MDNAATLALAEQAQERHACTPSITCALCLPVTRWPCGAHRRAQTVIDELSATTHPPAPIHPDWQDGRGG